MRVKLLLLTLAAVLCAAPAFADLPPNTAVSIGFQGYGVNTTYINVGGQDIVNNLSVSGPSQAFLGHFQSVASTVAPIAMGDWSQYTFQLNLSYVGGFNPVSREAYYAGTWLLYSPLNGVNLPQYSEKATMSNLKMTYNSQFTSGAWDGQWTMANDGARGSDWTGYNPLMVVNGTWDSYSDVSNAYFGQPEVNMHAHANVPEASTVLLGLSGLTSVLGLRRLRRK